MSHREVRVELGERSYSVLVGSGLIEQSGSLVAGLGPRRSTILVTNPTVAALYLETVERSLHDAGCGGLFTVEIPDGERFKNLAAIEKIYDAALGHGIDRSSVVVALGGGVVGDVAGFAAATLLRGIDLVMIPTTLLAQVDSSVGGKTGINRPQGKNLVGAFHQPSLVISDAGTLSTLPDREYAAGLAEVVKYGMILDPDLFALLEARAADILMPDLQRIGGLSEMRRAAAIASVYHVPISTHIFTEQSICVAAAEPNCLSVEHMPWFAELFNESMEIHEGYIQVPQRPGTGFTFNRETIDRYRIS